MYCPCFASSALSEISMPVTTGSVFPALMALISVVRMDALYLVSASMNSHKPTRAPIGTPTAIPAANTTAMRMTCRSVGLCHITSAFCRTVLSAERREIGVGQQRAVSWHSGIHIGTPHEPSLAHLCGPGCSRDLCTAPHIGPAAKWVDCLRATRSPRDRQRT